jgi:hypothetical protein
LKNKITVYCPKKLRDRWPDPLAALWHQTYPFFDDDDLRITRKQQTRHFYEWFVAVHLYHRYGAHSLIEKYRFAAHPEKKPKLAAVLSEKQVSELDEICDEFSVQVPDLISWLPGTSRRWFVEVKGQGDRLSKGQIASHKGICDQMGLQVQVVSVDLVQ